MLWDSFVGALGHAGTPKPSHITSPRSTLTMWVRRFDLASRGERNPGVDRNETKQRVSRCICSVI